MSDPAEKEHKDSGHFIWHDLMTQDADQASAYYSELLGWQIKELPMGEMTYRMIHVGQTGIGGVVALADASMPCHWLGYVSTPDVAATVQRVQELGGAVGVPPTEIPDVGTFAVLRDPQGALFSTMEPAHAKAPQDPGSLARGMACWTELWTPDPVAADRFYGEVFGWRSETKDLAEMGSYYLQNAGENQVGGIMKSPDPEALPYWCPYFQVAGIEEQTRRAKDLGGEVIMPVREIPEVGQFSLAEQPVDPAAVQHLADQGIDPGPSLYPLRTLRTRRTLGTPRTRYTVGLVLVTFLLVEADEWRTTAHAGIRHRGLGIQKR